MGRNDEALTEAKRSLQADPLSSLANLFVGSVLVFSRQWDPAIEQLRSGKELDPTFWFLLCFLGRVYEQNGSLSEAITEFQNALELEKDNSETWSSLGHAYALSGNRVEKQKILDRLKGSSAGGYVALYNVAVICAGLGEKDQAFACSIGPTKIVPTIWPSICQPTRGWMASAPTRALLTYGGA